MKTKDGRKIDHATLEWIRIQAVKAVVEDKKSPEVVIEGFGLHRTNIYKWLKKFAKEGWAGLRSTTADGPDSILTDREKGRLGKLLQKNPSQYSLDFGLWTLEMVQTIIERKFRKHVSIATVSRYLHEIGYTPQRPLMRAYEQNPEKVAEWIEKEYPRIKREAKRERREIFFGDEAGFRSTHHGGTTWGKEGKTPVVRTTGKRFGCNCISAMSRRGKLRFMLFEGTCTADVFIDFLQRLLQHRKTPVTLIVDGHPTHKTKKVREFVAATKGKLKLYILPPYSPELNPDEQVWNNTKASLKRKLIGGKQAFIAQIRTHLHSLQKRYRAIASFFWHPDVAYAM